MAFVGDSSRNTAIVHARLLKNLGMGLLRRGYCGVLAVYERTIVLPIVKRVETFN